jgi:hypothetical protein
MAKKNQFDVGKIHYLHIRDLAFNYLIPENTLLSRERSESIRSNMEIVKTIGLSEKIIRLLFTIELKAYEKGKKEASATYTTEHLFKVDNIEELASKSEGEFEIDAALDTTLTGLAYSTVRGKLHEKFNGTLFSDFILPIVRPADLGKPNS